MSKSTNELTSIFNFKKYLDDKVAFLSGGTKQKLNLSLALLHDPDLIILDEPYSGFDWETYLRFWELSERLVSMGKSILIVSHFLIDTKKFNRQFYIDDGKFHEKK